MSERKKNEKLIEPQIVNILINLFDKVTKSGLIKVSKSGAVLRTGFNAAAKIKNIDIPWPLVLPDFILVFDDYSSERIDEYLIVAVETKWFKLKNINDKLRDAYRNFGQPLRNYIYGFDSVILMHLFDEDIDEDKIKLYTETTITSIEMLKLPMVYFSMQIFEKKKLQPQNEVFSIYSPIYIEITNIEYITSYLSRLTSSTRNPILKNYMFNDKIMKRRAALKVSLSLP